MIQDLIVKYAIRVVAVIFAIWIHEVPKYFLTLYLTKPAYRKDVKINDVWAKSIDPIGFILLVFAQYGWQMPLKIDASKLINKKNGLIAITLLGYLVSLIAAIIFLLISSYFPRESAYDFIRLLLRLMSYYCTALLVVNFIPVLPLDMTKIAYAVSSTLYFKMVENVVIIQSLFIIFLLLGGLESANRLVFERIIKLVEIWI